ncbi:hypothetical protein [Actinokineospora spheciospongiae]|uniref:hypothetical protein n=1 Tax=Actinokineospora spheciospongiae TaxID=909613 RepID=UPI0004B5FDF7|nr:hypothetical protein [Actinokineospora spheciospongiae]
MSAGEPAVALHAVLAKLTAVRECLVVAATVIEQAVSIIGYMPTSCAAVLEELRVVWRSVAETEQLIEAHLASAEHPGNGTPSSGAPQVPSQVGPNPTPARPRLAPSPASPGVEKSTATVIR